MTPFRTIPLLFLAVLGIALSPAQSRAAWGPRVGLSDDPDQFLVGLHWSAQGLSRELGLQPNFTVGTGSNLRTFLFSLPVHWRVPSTASVAPYVGGGVVIGAFDREGSGSDPNFEIGIDAIGGLEWRSGRARRFALELNLGFGDLHDIKVFGVWTLP